MASQCHCGAGARLLRQPGVRGLCAGGEELRGGACGQPVERQHAFSSGLPTERIRDLFAARAQEYTAVPGLLQKYYLHYGNGQHGGVYVWDCRESMQAFRASELSRSACDVYQVQESALDAAGVVLALRPEPAAA